MEKYIWIAICLFCFILFFLIGFVTFMKKKAVHFWSSSKSRVTYITDEKKYNRANGLMWMLFSSGYVVAAAIAYVIGLELSAIIMGVWTVVGLPLLLIIYKLFINRKYKKVYEEEL